MTNGRGNGLGKRCGRGNGRSQGQGRGCGQGQRYMGSKMGTDPLQNSGNSQGMGNRLHYTAEVDKEKCCCCELCIDMCPVEAITMEDIIVIDAARCTACGACINGCSSNAISLTKKVLL